MRPAPRGGHALPCRALADCRPPHRALLGCPASTARTRPSRRPAVSTRPNPPARRWHALAGAPTPARRTWEGGRSGVDRRPPCLRSPRTPAPIFEHRGGHETGERTPKPLTSLHVLHEGLSCAPHTPAAPLVAHESALEPTAHTAIGQLLTERNPVSRGNQTPDPWCDTRSP